MLEGKKREENMYLPYKHITQLLTIMHYNYNVDNKHSIKTPANLNKQKKP